MKQFCTECGQKFESANLVCPYCEFKNKPIPGQKTIEETMAESVEDKGAVHNWFHLLDGLFVPSKRVVNKYAEERDSHPMTIKEFDEWQAWMILARLPGRIHEGFVQQRQHEEIMDELRRR